MCCKNFILLRPINGLCNRLRTIISFKILADYLKIPLYVYWSISNGFDNTNWNDIFINNNIFISINSNTWNYYRNITYHLDESYDINYILDNYNNLNGISCISSLDLKYLFVNILKLIPNYNELYLNYFNSLQLIENLNSQVIDYIDKLLKNIMNYFIEIHL